MATRPRHKDLCHTYEPINTHMSNQLSEEYGRLEAEKAYVQNLGPNERIVYDSIEYPPSKKDGDNSPYIDENDLVEIQ